MKKGGKSEKRDLGLYGEKIAEDYLRRRNYIILERNYRSRFGEVDLIALDGDILCFTEVKTRRSDLFGAPQEAVDLRKQVRLADTAKDYITRSKNWERKMRFDVIAITLDSNHQPSMGLFSRLFKKSPQVEHIQNAFEIE